MNGETVPVVQSDREAAARLFIAMGGTHTGADMILSAEADGAPAVQAIAAARLATETPLRTALLDCGTRLKAAEEELARLACGDVEEREEAALRAALDRIGWPEIRAFQAELARGQDIYEDAGGFMLRAIKALFGVKRADLVVTHRQAAEALVAALSQSQGDRG